MRVASNSCRTSTSINTTRASHTSSSLDKEFIVKTTVSSSKKKLCVEWCDGTVSEFAAVWLRDNCPDPRTTHPTSFGRLLLMSDLDTEITIGSASVERSSMKITWPDNHTSTFPTQWLRARAWSPPPPPPGQVLWGAGYDLSRHQYHHLLADDAALLAWLEDLAVSGLTIVENTPCNTESMKDLQSRIGSAKTTHFGQFWNVKTKADAMNLAYTSATLGLHLDLPFYSYTPGVQFLQCIKQYTGTGGDNHFTDAFAVAEKMRKEFLAEFKLLSETGVHFWDAGVLDTDEDTEKSGKFHKRNTMPTFLLDSQGKVKQVAFNNQVRSSQPSGDANLTLALYRALKIFNNLCYSEEFLVKYKLKEGDIAVFDNMRVMHGREGFTVREGEDGSRHLYGCYIDWDEINDRRNVLNNVDWI